LPERLADLLVKKISLGATKKGLEKEEKQVVGINLWARG
jgi:hypothetical protein